MNRLLWSSGGDAILLTPPSGYLDYRYTHMFTPAQLCSSLDCLTKTAPPQSSIFEVQCAPWLTTVWLNQRINSAGSSISDAGSEAASRLPHFTRPNRGRPNHSQPVRCSRRARLPCSGHFIPPHEEASPFRIFLQV
jgi:hypothetical protein